jgi:hypothetical protein
MTPVKQRLGVIRRVTSLLIAGSRGAAPDGYEGGQTPNFAAGLCYCKPEAVCNRKIPRFTVCFYSKVWFNTPRLAAVQIT